MSKIIEEGIAVMVDYKKLEKIAALKKDVIPVIVQSYDTREVLMLAYANEEALIHSIENNTATFWSTSRDELWVKGKTSGSILEIVDVRTNCEQNSLLFSVRCEKGLCHTRDSSGNYRSSCYYRKILMAEDGKLKLML